MKEAVAATVFMFELNLFQVLRSRNYVLSCPLFVLKNGISSAICNLVLYLFRESIKMLFRYDGAILFQYINTVVEVNSSALYSAGSQFNFLK